MKIAIPVSDRGQGPAVADSFGRAPYFLIHDEATGLQEVIENAAARSAGGAGIRAAQAVVDSGARVLLTPRCGSNAARVLLKAGLKLYQSDSALSAAENLAAFKNSGLQELTEIHPGFHRGH